MWSNLIKHALICINLQSVNYDLNLYFGHFLLSSLTEEIFWNYKMYQGLQKCIIWGVCKLYFLLTLFLWCICKLYINCLSFLDNFTQGPLPLIHSRGLPSQPWALYLMSCLQPPWLSSDWYEAASPTLLRTAWHIPVRAFSSDLLWSSEIKIKPVQKKRFDLI